MLRIDALGAGGEYRTRKSEVIASMSGVAVAELSVVPPLYVSRTMAAQRKVAPLPAPRREEALSEAAGIFTGGVIAGLDFESYVRLASRISGVPIAVTRAGARGAGPVTPMTRPVVCAIDCTTGTASSVTGLVSVCTALAAPAAVETPARTSCAAPPATPATTSVTPGIFTASPFDCVYRDS
ncbi:hypothetical protein BN971_04225 [Mycobacterium bohemicum DSM 44277]|uniref:Uncharacterized protein n=1 Tax=Mycobacterium bohemicum DSM 44277 TaxID=1236609 RepID=A0A0U0WFF1_MYCBE|nr:hypothetical protein [Mycobacterium bohemicum]CPR12919.1 hypothetical protein BN971_04225 [Mycobacterium bohemicum DSM 44277]